MSFRHGVQFLIPLAWAAAMAGWAATGGSVAGTVADPSGGVMPAVQVLVRNAATGATQTAATNGDGFFAFPDLPKGRYELAVNQSGFQPYRAVVAVEANGALRTDIQLTLESQTDAVTVSESAARVETTTTQMGELIAAKQVASIPVNGRSYTDLLALQPGVVPASSQQPNAVVMSGCTTAPPSGDLNPGNLSVSGQRETANGFMVNGGTVQEDFNMGAAIVPNLDSIQEFRVLTSNFDAEYGNFSGGQVLVTTKSGTNELHGSAFEFLRNTDLDARNYFSAGRAQYDRNQFGGTVGGAVRKDKVFFFADYQGTRMTEGVDTGLISVPSAANRAGDFSADAAHALRHRQRPVLGEPAFAEAGLCGAARRAVLHCRAVRTPSAVRAAERAAFPQRAWSAPAKALLPFIPTPNQGSGIFSTSAYNQTLRDDKGAVKMDANTRWGALSAYYFSDDYSLDNPYPTGARRRRRSRLQRDVDGPRAARRAGADHHPQLHLRQRIAPQLHAHRQQRRAAGRRRRTHAWLRKASWIPPASRASCRSPRTSKASRTWRSTTSPSAWIPPAPRRPTTPCSGRTISRR